MSYLDILVVLSTDAVLLYQGFSSLYYESSFKSSFSITRSVLSLDV